MSGPITNRELFNSILNFRKPARTPMWRLEPVAEQSVRKWCRDEGFPLEMSGADSVDFDGELFTLNLGSQPPLPTFPPVTLSSGKEYTVKQNIFGMVVKSPRKWTVWPTRDVFIRAPLTTMADWQRMKKRYDYTDPRRYPLHWSREMADHYNNSGDPVTVVMNWGPANGVKNGYLFGFERFMEILVSESTILENMFEFWADFMIHYLRNFVSLLKIDAFFFKDDGMGIKGTSLISPSTFRSLYSSCMRKVTDFLHSYNVDNIGYYSSGNLNPLLPVLLETGIDLIAPVESNAGMDAVELREKYGRDLLMMGNIAKESIMSGKNAIAEEVDRKVPFLMETGGYIPAIDDMVMPDMKYENVRYCVDLIKSIVP